MASWIIDGFPADYDIYAEPFGGAFWVHLLGGGKADRVIYNDINSDMANVWRCISSDYDELYRIMAEMFGYKENEGTFCDVRDAYTFDEACDDADYERASRYLYIYTNSFVGSPVNSRSLFAKRGNRNRSRYTALMRKLMKRKYRNRIDMISEVRNMDALDVIGEYDSESTFFYVDPPYYGVRNLYNCVDYDFSDHKKLSDMLTGIRGKFALSYYDFDELDDWYPPDRYSRRGLRIKSNMSHGHRGHRISDSRNKREEILITNYDEISPLIKLCN